MLHVTFAIEVDEESAEAVADVLASKADAEIQSASKANVHGSAETIIQLVELALSAISSTEVARSYEQMEFVSHRLTSLA